MPCTTYRARWIAPVASPLIENGHVVVDNGLVVSVERSNRPHPAAVDLGDAVVLPGLVNAHTHLELTVCHRSIPYRGSFADWIADLVSANPHRGSGEVLEHSVRDGFKQSLSAGVTALADIGHGRPVLQAWSQAPLHTVGFLEVLGMGAVFKQITAGERSVAAAAAMCKETPLLRIGIAPHAPYTTDAAMYREAIEFATRTGRPICTHLAETREEGQFLADGTGPLRDFLERWNLWDGSFDPPGCSPVEYAHRLGLLACGPLLAHVNYVTDADLELLAGTGSSVAYCPRTHRFFGHEPHRFRDMLARGINVCIGTDSLASNDTLSVLDELRFLAASDPALSPSQLLAMGTLAGARALGFQDQIGSLSPGKRADMVAVALDQATTGEPIGDLLSSAAPPAAVYLGGERLPDEGQFK